MERILYFISNLFIIITFIFCFAVNWYYGDSIRSTCFFIGEMWNKSSYSEKEFIAMTLTPIFFIFFQILFTISFVFFIAMFLISSCVYIMTYYLYRFFVKSSKERSVNLRRNELFPRVMMQ